MSKSKYIDLICVAAVVVATLLACLSLNGAALGVQAKTVTMGYEQRLFDPARVHTLDIVIDDWDAFLQTAQSEEYSVCSVVIDGEAFKNVGIRGKGNTSLSSVASMDSSRYSFKIEFDQYDSTNTYYGLDKLSLNNLIQDNTMMKDYLVYRMMDEFGVAAPLCSYVYITVNGEDWGLYLAVEAVEESFLQRNYGNDYGELYKPDSMNMGGGRGNGMDFNMEDFMEPSGEDAAAAGQEGFALSQRSSGSSGQFGSRGQQGGQTAPGSGSDRQSGFDFGSIDFSQMGGMGSFGMGSGETKLQYIDDDPESYSTIFSSAKTDVTAADQARLIAALKDLSAGDQSAVDAEAVIRYFVVHNFAVNSDSYTGSMVHNYYLYEEGGRLSMIPWDYNLAFGTFQGGDATGAVNDDIDAPLSVTGSDRPMVDWLLGSEQYHQYFQAFLDTVDAQAIIAQAKELIAPYVQRDPTKFCTYEEFEAGVETLAEFCWLRCQSVEQQLAGQTGSVDASSITLSDMGTMGGGFGGMGQRPSASGDTGTQMPSMPGGGSGSSQMPQMPGGQGGMQMPGQFSGFGSAGTEETTGDGQQFPDFGAQDGMQMPGQFSGFGGAGTEETTGDSQQFSGFGAQGGMTFPDGMQMPEGMEDMFSGQSGVSGRGQTASGSAQTGGGQGLLMLVSILFLAAGLLFAGKYKR